MIRWRAGVPGSPLPSRRTFAVGLPPFASEGETRFAFVAVLGLSYLSAGTGIPRTIDGQETRTRDVLTAN